MSERKLLYASAPARSERQKAGYVVDGVTYPRVTQVLSVIAKPGLEGWRLRVGVEEARRISREAADFGTRVHEACHAIDRDWHGYEPTLVDADLRPFVAAYHAWATEHVAELLGAEVTVHHPVHKVAGTYDRLYRLKSGLVALKDLKTSKSPDGNWPIQLAAYKSMIEYHGQPVDVCGVIRLPSDQPGKVYLLTYDDETMAHAAKTWKACVRMFRHQQKHGDDWRRLTGEEFHWMA